ncbi:hypothetical protein BT96DRAFT_1020458 [Gymnopus androsaceus JB14]|uniref:DUF6533 domain-containing protein n=1 Tax=Gymnopus androsaceus JB14 TaxID=1447944 RepID=A0A6A4HJP1_9AGAR|nr:hypothetical protein BT96DRAFT_1020458 [Gymnopus androsaceus JB14]
MSADTESLITVVKNFNASRYLTAAGVTILFYDHLLTFSAEYELIWRAEWKLPKVLFLLIRYIVPLCLLLLTHQMSGIGNSDVTDLSCKVVFNVALMLGVLTIAVGNFLVMLHVWNLWERSRRLILWSLFLFIVTQVANVACGIITVLHMIPIVSFNPIVRACVIAQRVTFVIMWAPGLSFEIAMMTIVMWNAILRPRSNQSEFAKIVHRDGVVYFVILSTLRLINLVLAVVAPLSLIFLGVFNVKKRMSTENESFATVVKNFNASRYLTAAGVTILSTLRLINLVLAIVAPLSLNILGYLFQLV